MKRCIARINWLYAKKWIPPVISIGERVPSNAYHPTIVFEGQYEGPIWDGNGTITVDKEKYNELVSKKESIATVSYLVEEAPHELIRSGAKFELYDGKMIIAVGTVLSICVG